MDELRAEIAALQLLVSGLSNRVAALERLTDTAKGPPRVERAREHVIQAAREYLETECRPVKTMHGHFHEHAGECQMAFETLQECVAHLLEVEAGERHG